MSTERKITVSSRNSTSEALDNAEIFTGQWEDISDYATVFTTILADQSCSLTIEFSNDAPSTVPNTRTAAKTVTRAISASTADQIILDAGYSFVRVKVENDSGSDMTSLVMSTKLLDQINKFYYVSIEENGSSSSVVSDPSGVINSVARQTTGVTRVTWSSVLGGVAPGIAGGVAASNIVVHRTPVDATNDDIITKLNSTGGNFTGGTYELIIYNKA